MITTKKPNEVFTHGMSDPSRFQIKANGKAFISLVSNLYSRKIHAILRELGCNAVDAHKMAGKGDVPFKVVLPTALLNEFHIRDYGSGISEDDIATIYTVLFESTKENTNDAIGCFGLGSKTPFAYTSSFIVQSFQDGIVKTYNMYLSEDQCPCYTKVGEKETDEENGLLIKFGVAPYDRDKFTEAARDVYKWFSLKPEINISDINLDLNLDIEHEGGNYKIVNSSGSHLIMGNIAYPLNTYRNEIWNSSDENRMLVYNFLSRTNLICEVPIGTFDIAMSREEMSLDETSINNITEIILEVIEDYKKKWSVGLEKIFNMDSYFQSCVEFANYNDKILTLFGDLEKEAIHVKSGKELALSIPYDASIFDVKCYRVNNRGRGNYSVTTTHEHVFNPRYFFANGDNIPYSSFYVVRKDTKNVTKRVRNYLLNNCPLSWNNYEYKVYLINEDKLDDFLSEYDIPRDLIKDIEDMAVPVAVSNPFSNYTPKEGRVTKNSVRGDIRMMSKDEDGKFINKVIEDGILDKDTENVFYTRGEVLLVLLLGFPLDIVYSGEDSFDLICEINDIDPDDSIYFIKLKSDSSFNKVSKWDNDWRHIRDIDEPIRHKKEDVAFNAGINRIVNYLENNSKGHFPRFVEKHFRENYKGKMIDNLLSLKKTLTDIPEYFNEIKMPFSINYWDGLNINSIGDKIIKKANTIKNVFGDEAETIWDIYVDKNPKVKDEIDSIAIEFHKYLSGILLKSMANGRDFGLTESQVELLKDAANSIFPDSGEDSGEMEDEKESKYLVLT